MSHPTRTTAHRSTATLRVPTAQGALVLGRYRLHKPLGSGGFGTVWLAYDERLERDVAVKMLPRARVIGGRFEREARAAARLNHPGIVTLYEAAVDTAAAYLVSELVRGATFADLLDAGQLSDRDVIAIGIALCDALDHAHRQAIVHRDVKPSNVLVPEQPSSPAAIAKLTDFGVARVIGGNPLTHTGDVVGTAAYMAPEQAEGREADAAADLYSLALVLYEALSGLNPLAPNGAPRVRRLAVHLPPLRRYRRDLPPELGRGIDQALRPRARERGSMAELRAALAAAVHEVEDEPQVIELPWSPSAAEPPPERLSPSPPRDINPPAGLERALAGAGAAALTGWLLATAFSSPPLAPAGAALLAGAAVAVLPRLGWLALTLGAAIALVAADRTGFALVVATGLLLPVLLAPRTPSRWPLAVAAPVLGILTLAGAWPALAGWTRGVWRRATLGALGWVWLTLSGLVGGHPAYVQPPPSIPASARWMASPDQAIRHVLLPLLHSGVLAPALVWAAAAALLRWIIRGPVPVRLVLIAVWSAGLASATTTALTVARSGATVRPGVVVLGALGAAILAAVPTLFAARKQLSAYSDNAAGLA